MFYRAIDSRNGAILYFDCDRIITWNAKATGNNSEIAEFTIYLAADGAPPIMTHFYCKLDDVDHINKELASAVQLVIDTSNLPPTK